VTIPSTLNWNDPMWRRWIEWRHRNLNNFLLAIHDAARSAKPDILTFVETVTCDYKYATVVGLDGAYLRKAEGISHVWEVDVVNLAQGMRPARENDWVSMICMYKYCRAASGLKPAWAFSYGRQADDASLVMAEVIACGCNPFEIKTPNMEATVNAAMRTRMYGFIAAHQDRIYSATSTARVAVYHSSACRDYVDGPNPGSGMYCTKLGGNNGWSDDPNDLTTAQQWLAEYRGTIKAMIAAHIPFNVLTSPGFDDADLARYRVLFLPDCEAMSAAEVAVVKAFVQRGGLVIITGPKPAWMNQYGDLVNPPALNDILGPPGVDHRPYGPAGGRIIYYSDLPGKAYLASNTQSAYDRLVNPALSHAPVLFTTTAPRQVHMETSALGREIVMQFVNFSGVTGTFTSAPKTFSVSVSTARPVPKVEVASPDAASPGLTPIPFTVAAGKVTFNLTVQQYSMVVVTTA
jgi:hypothetical protein